MGTSATAKARLKEWVNCIWEEKERDISYALKMDQHDRLDANQFTDSTGSIANNLHDITILSSNEIDEPGESGGQTIKSRILQVEYKFYNVV